jgi:hypothetical protein
MMRMSLSNDLITSSLVLTILELILDLFVNPCTCISKLF